MTDMQQPLNGGEQKKSRNKRERQAQKHAETIANFNLTQNSQIMNGYVSGTERKATNCFCLMFFLVYLLACIGLAATGMIKGNFQKLVAGVDTDNRMCGNAQGVMDYPNFLYYVGTNDELYGTCVKTCPDTDKSKIECATTQYVKTCTPLANKGYATTNIIGLCIPKDMDAFDTTVGDKFRSLMNTQQMTQFWKDLQIAAPAVYISLALGLVYTIIYLYLMSNCAHMLAYVAIGLMEVILLAGIGGSVYAATRGGPDANGAWIGAGCGAVFFLLWNIMLCCYWSKLQIAIAVIDATADFMAATKRIISVTIYYFIITLIVLLVGGFGILGTVAINDVTWTMVDGQYQKTIVFTNANIAMLCISAFGLFWIFSFIREKTKFIYMISAAQYYYTSNKDKEGSASVCSSMAIANFKHAGSIAYGSFLHTLIAVLRMIVDALVDAAEKKSDNNGIVVCIGCLLKCCMSCIESFIEYLNLNAYAYMAVSGDPYCKSAWNGFMMNLKHLVKFYFADMLAGMFVFMGILTIVGLNGGTCYLIMKYGFKNSHLLSSIWVPLIIIMVATFIIAELFIGFFSVAVRATLMSLAIDLELNGSPKFGTPSFHEKMEAAMADDYIPGVPQNQNGNAQVYQQHQPGSNQVYTQPGQQNNMY